MVSWNESSTVKIGQVWSRRKSGRRYTVTDEKFTGGMRDVLLVPLSTGRKSWKWDCAVVAEMTRCDD